MKMDHTYIYNCMLSVSNTIMAVAYPAEDQAPKIMVWNLMIGTYACMYLYMLI